MSQFFDLASMVLVPSGYRDGKLYSQKPLSSSGELTFSRGSDIEATRVASNGYIEKAKVNLVLQSNTFSDAAWTKTRSSLVSGQAGYDGTNNAWAYVDTTDNSTHLMVQNLSVGATLSTFSVYAKAAAVNFLILRFEGSTGVDYAYFNLSNGTLGTIDSDYIDAEITPAGNGFYRCSVSRILGASGNQAIIYSAEADNDPTYAGAGTTAIYIQDAQINYGLVAQEYQETTTTSVVSGITNDMPRLDYSGGASCPNLLLEGQRTNIVTSTEYLEYGWSLANNATTSVESVITPDGGTLASKVQANSGDTSGRNQDGLGTLGTDHTFSGFFKGTGEATRLRFRNNQGEGVYYDIDADGNFSLYTTDASSHGIEEYPNGWHRIWVLTTTSGATTNYIQIYPDVANGTGSVYAWGMQAEEGSYPTSYIPNYGAAGSVTRGADACSKTGISSLIGQTAGSFYFEYEPNDVSVSTAQDYVPFAISDGTSANALFFNDYNGSLRFIIQSSGAVQAIFQFDDLVAGNTYKIAVGYNTNDVALYINGVLIGTDTSVSIPATSKISLNSFTSPVHIGSINVKQSLLFKTRLSNADLATLTA